LKTFDTEECAEFLKVDRTTILRLAANGFLPGAKIGRGWVFIEDDIVEYLRIQTKIQQRSRQNEYESSLKKFSDETKHILPIRSTRRKRLLP
jgi:excisionase family DNA binding protein